MTYGEAMIQAREQATLNKEHFALEVPPCEKKMSYEKLCKYYNDKLFAYWLSCLKDNIPMQMKKKVLRYLLGRLYKCL